MSCDNELANEWARCSGKNASYITMKLILWLAPQAGKMNQILLRDSFGYPVIWQDEAILPGRDYPPCPARKISPKEI